VGCAFTMASLQVYSLSIDGWQWREHTPDVEGDIPEARYGHAAAALEGHALLLCAGGDAEAGRFRSDVAVLDTRTWRWSAPATVVRRRVHILACKSTQFMCPSGPAWRCWTRRPQWCVTHCAATPVLAQEERFFVLLPVARAATASSVLGLQRYGALPGLTSSWHVTQPRKGRQDYPGNRVIVMRVQAGSTPDARTGHVLAALAAPGEAPRFLVVAGRGPGDVLHSDAWVLQMRPQEAVVPASV